MRRGAALTIPSDPRFLRLVRDFTAGMAEEAGLGGKTAEDIKLAVDEACSNVIKHAYGGSTDRTIKVKYRKTPGAFEVVIEDEGRKARKEDMRGRDLGEIRAGGLGIHFIRRVFDVFELDERKKKGNRLRLIKRLEAGGAD